MSRFRGACLKMGHVQKIGAVLFVSLENRPTKGTRNKRRHTASCGLFPKLCALTLFTSRGCVKLSASLAAGLQTEAQKGVCFRVPNVSCFEGETRRKTNFGGVQILEKTVPRAKATMHMDKAPPQKNWSAHVEDEQTKKTSSAKPGRCVPFRCKLINIA